MFKNFRLMTREFTAADFRKSMSDFEVRGISDYLTEVLHDIHGRDYTDRAEYFPKLDADDFFGLAYTSSGIYAELGVTANYRQINKLGIPDHLYISHFVITDSQYPMLVAVCQDDDENEYFYSVDTTPASEF